jgi:hypothetical protein
MDTPLLLLEVRRRRDFVLARRHARQVAGLLGFDPHEQACIAALVFELASQVRSRLGTVRLRFAVDGDRLLIAPAVAPGEEAPPLRIEKPLPRREPPVSTEDLAWVMRQVNELAPAGLFEEVQRQNQELLRALLELQTCQARLAELTVKQTAPTAA